MLSFCAHAFASPRLGRTVSIRPTGDLLAPRPYTGVHLTFLLYRAAQESARAHQSYNPEESSEPGLLSPPFLHGARGPLKHMTGDDAHGPRCSQGAFQTLLVAPRVAGTDRAVSHHIFSVMRRPTGSMNKVA